MSINEPGIRRTFLTMGMGDQNPCREGIPDLAEGYIRDVERISSPVSGSCW